MTRFWPLMVSCVVLLAACSMPDDDRPSPTPSPKPRYETPIALVVHHGRDIDSLSLDQAKAVIGGEVREWDEISGGTGEIHLVTAEVSGTKGIERVARERGAVNTVARDRQALGIVPAYAVIPRVRALDVDGHDPLRGDRDYPLTTSTDVKPGTALVTAITGDIMMGRRVGAYLKRVGDPAAVLRPFSRRLATADVTVGNLESTLSDDGAPQQGGDSFAADPSTLAGLELAGFDAISLGNNHFGDYQRRAMLDTVELLDDAGIAIFGGGRDLEQARAPAIVERRGVRIGFIGTDSIGETPAATSTSPGTNRINAPPRTGPLDRDTLDRVAADINDLDERVDIVIVIPHWGRQYTPEPEHSQRVMARAFVEAGADLVAGGHPHWVQGWETFDGGTVVYSTGNFVFDMTTRETQEGLVLEVVTRGDRVVAIDTVPYVIGSRNFTPRPARNQARVDAIYDLVRGASEVPFDRLRP